MTWKWHKKNLHFFSPFFQNTQKINLSTVQLRKKKLASQQRMQWPTILNANWGLFGGHSTQNHLSIVKLRLLSHFDIGGDISLAVNWGGATLVEIFFIPLFIDFSVMIFKGLMQFDWLTPSYHYSVGGVVLLTRKKCPPLVGGGGCWLLEDRHWTNRRCHPHAADNGGGGNNDNK